MSAVQASASAPGLVLDGPRPATHATAALSDLLWPRARPATAALLHTPGLELLANARSAIHRACVDVRARDPQRPRMLLPAFHCPSIVTACLAAGLEPVFYRIRSDLRIDLDDLAAKIDERTGSALLIHFFGIEADPRATLLLQAAGLRILEDWSHSFLKADGAGLCGNAQHDRIFSFWKLLPTGLGGGLAWGQGRAASEPLEPAKFGREDARMLKALLEESILHKGPRWLGASYSALEALRLRLKGRPVPSAAASAVEDEAALAEQGEHYYPFDPGLATRAIPGWCRRLMSTADLPAIGRARQRNFSTYLQELPASKKLRRVVDQVPDAAPWVFPVLVPERDRLDRGWRAQGVALHTFGIYLHSALFAGTDAPTVNDARTLARQLLCLSVHQDLQPHDIERSCEILAR